MPSAKSLVVVVSLFVSCLASARSLEDVEFPEEVSLGTQKLVLNGAGLRTKRKLGMNFKVYVAGLWTTKKTPDAAALVTGSEPKILELVFLRGLDKDTLREAWTEGYDKNCKADCAAAQAAFKAFNDLMVDVKDKSRLRMTFEKDSVSIEISGKEARKGSVTGEAIRRALLAIFIGDHPPTDELKKGLLGG